MNNHPLTGTVAVVVGASSGIGKGCAIELAKAGAVVACVARRKEKLKDTVAIIEGNGGTASYHVADMVDGDIADMTTAAIMEKYGRIDLWLNSVAIGGDNIGPTWELDKNLWWKEFTVFLKHAFEGTRCALKVMTKQNSGRIVNIGGGGTDKPHLFSSAYSTAKTGLARFVENIDWELKAVNSNVQIFDFNPGLVLTELTAGMMKTESGKKYLSDLCKTLAAGKTTPPEDVGKYLVWIASGAIDKLSGRIVGASQDRQMLISKADELVEKGKAVLRIN